MTALWRKRWLVVLVLFSVMVGIGCGALGTTAKQEFKTVGKQIGTPPPPDGPKDGEKDKKAPEAP